MNLNTEMTQTKNHWSI